MYTGLLFEVLLLRGGIFPKSNPFFLSVQNHETDSAIHEVL
ncbi:hypothetical protein HMPREF1990_01829 [Porphyromonas gingivalis W4087]|uniref:Uncharacterized protein n=1 Tax=Porphyromonas gingivalis F0570 TaxID=1227271 RepID=A0A0E2M4N7_PORGN|nr:hypothetical protein HMPREF1555_01454 [Porphyromonas gingivalis F0570]ERJ68917.1 hypothetical protein HMPREF1553_00816 [Porphyromonas gingivalis F0568]ERJ71416.1 hypothetical protein HMPREF1554_00166 [Porphyromonas gingivalis F0569]ERJ87293.1 hypothetical protein HMPREF1990_01829 [Porphyromonas gingivalis W4087]ERJ88431.1 hypothetical protein HMPREF1989_00335 [Porphyromonas gingivalis F0566]